MRILTTFVRFYKSLNYDYVRKSHPEAIPDPWEMIDTKWFPFVRVKMEPDVTTVVGANESGKTHLLRAIEKGLGSAKIPGIDFCRHSEFFSVESGKSRFPDFGFEFGSFTEAEEAAIRDIIQWPDEAKRLDSIVYLRLNNEEVVYWRDNDEWKSSVLKQAIATKFRDILPDVYWIEASVGLPDMIPLSELIMNDEDESAGLSLPSGEQARAFDAILKDAPNLSKPQYLRDQADPLAQRFALMAQRPTLEATDVIKRQKQYEIARTLIYDIARIDPAKIRELYDSALVGEVAYVSALTSSINVSLAENLDFQRWWTQDDQFQLRVTADGLNLCFCIRDRTQRDYLFRERSSGLKYFLGYLIQYLSFKPSTERGAVVLMDEPDAFLSSSGQQSLLQLFDAFASSTESSNSRQVIYVTHSPFLIDKNRSWRIRVIEKGIEDDGTRVIHDASQNRYEPLRSSLGIFVGETAFISGCNLIVEGLSDQVLLVGLNAFLRKRNHYLGDTLNLNELTIVPAGGADNVPYMVRLAVGRDTEKPAVVALLDSDEDGTFAATEINLSGLLNEAFVLRVDDAKAKGLQLPEGSTLEDLVPAGLFFAAGQRYLDLLNSTTRIKDDQFKEFEALLNQDTHNPYKALSQLITKKKLTPHKFSKVGLMKCVVELLDQPGLVTFNLKEDILKLEADGKVVLGWLNDTIRKALSTKKRDELRVKIRQTRKRFFRDNKHNTTRSAALGLIDELIGQINEDLGYVRSRTELLQLRADIDPEGDQNALIVDFDTFTAIVNRVENASKLLKESYAGGDVEAIEFAPDTVVRKVERAGGVN